MVVYIFFALREARTALMWMWAAEKLQGSEQLHHKRLPTRAAPRDPSRHRPPRNDGHCEAVVFQRDMHLLKLYKATRKDLNADRCSRDAHMVIIVSFSISKLSWYLTQIPAAIGRHRSWWSWESWESWTIFCWYLGMGRNPIPLFCSHQNSWDLWMFIPLKMVCIAIDP